MSVAVGRPMPMTFGGTIESRPSPMLQPAASPSMAPFSVPRGTMLLSPGASPAMFPTMPPITFGDLPPCAAVPMGSTFCFAHMGSQPSGHEVFGNNFMLEQAFPVPMTQTMPGAISSSPLLGPRVSVTAASPQLRVPASPQLGPGLGTRRSSGLVEVPTASPALRPEAPPAGISASPLFHATPSPVVQARPRWASMCEDDEDWLPPAMVSGQGFLSLASVSGSPQLSHHGSPQMRPGMPRRRWASFSDSDNEVPAVPTFASKFNPPARAALVKGGQMQAVPYRQGPSFVVKGAMVPKGAGKGKGVASVGPSKGKGGGREGYNSSSVGYVAVGSRGQELAASDNGAEQEIELAPKKQQNGWTAIWVDERAFKAPQLKAHIERLGFLIKTYKSHDKAMRALDKKPLLPQGLVFLTNEVDAPPLVEYLEERQPGGLKVIVDAGTASKARAISNKFVSSQVTVVVGWEAAMEQLRIAGEEAVGPAYPSQARAEEGSLGLPPLEALPPAACTVAPEGGSLAAAADEQSWTVIWVSDQAFKPTGAPQKAKLEALGCNVKAYKSHQNATRALDKKRGLVRTAVLVSGIDAPPLLAYLAGRPDLSNVHTVVEASVKAPPVRTTATCEVVPSFERACMALQQVMETLEAA